MISQLTGTLDAIADNTLTLNVGGISYEIFVPTAILKNMGALLVRESQMTLVTYHYHQTDPSKSIPILIGFGTRIEKEFFERFITVSGVGPKAAVRALSMPIPDIAAAIDSGDVVFLKSLPGIGEQRAKEIVAKLQGKMGKFGLMRGGNGTAIKQAAAQDFREEAVEVLLQLQYKKEEAREMIQKALARKPDAGGVEELLNEVYRQKKGKA